MTVPWFRTNPDASRSWRQHLWCEPLLAHLRLEAEAVASGLGCGTDAERQSGRAAEQRGRLALRVSREMLWNRFLPRGQRGSGRALDSVCRDMSNAAQRCSEAVLIRGEADVRRPCACVSFGKAGGVGVGGGSLEALQFGALSRHQEICRQ